MKIHILNRKNQKNHPDVPIFRVDRSTPVGNPFDMEGDESKRDEVIARYKQYFLPRANDYTIDRAFSIYLEQILAAARKSDIALECWCAPKACHAQVIADWLYAEVLKYERCGNGG